MRWAFRLAADNAGNSNAARIAMMAITTSSSINVNARLRLFEFEQFIACLSLVNMTRRDAKFIQR